MEQNAKFTLVKKKKKEIHVYSKITKGKLEKLPEKSPQSGGFKEVQPDIGE